MAFRTKQKIEPWNLTFNGKEETQPHERIAQPKNSWHIWQLIGAAVLLLILSALWVVNR